MPNFDGRRIRNWGQQKAAEIAETESVYSIDERGDLHVDYAAISEKNFEGRSYNGGRKGNRSFQLMLSADAAKRLFDDGWRVETYQYDGRFENSVAWDTPVYFLNVVVNMDSEWPPRVTLCSEFNGKKSSCALHEDTISELDKTKLEGIYVVIHPNVYEGKKKGYLKILTALQSSDDTDRIPARYLAYMNDD